MRQLSTLLSFWVLFSSVFLTIDATTDKCEGKEKASVLIEISRDDIKEAKSLLPKCNKKLEQTLALLDEELDLIQVKKDDPKCPEPVPPTKQPVPPTKEPKFKPMDCEEILKNDQKKKSGVYKIWLRKKNIPFKSIDVYCDMKTDGGGWTVIQRRGKYSTPKDYFYKGWEDYKNGFGNVSEEFWFGNENLHILTKQGYYKLRFDLEDASGAKKYAVYSRFTVDYESNGYKVNAISYRGNAGDQFEGTNQMKFYTKDRNHRGNKVVNYAVEQKGAWWYGPHGSTANLNGIYQPGVESYTGVIWKDDFKKPIGLKKTEMKVKTWKKKTEFLD